MHDQLSANNRKIEVLRLEACTVYLSAGRVEHGTGRLEQLSPRERRLLAYLAERSNQVVPLEEILQRVFERPPGSASRAPGNTAATIRRKIERDPAVPAHLHIVRNKGWRLLLSQQQEGPKISPPRVALVGRDTWVERVGAALAQRSMWLTGPPLVGKSAVARTVASVWPQALWIDAGGCTEERLTDRIGVALGVPIRTRADLLGALSLRPGLLLVVDGVPPDLSALVTTLQQAVRVLATARTTTADAHTEALPPLSHQDAHTLLLREAQRRPDAADADDLARLIERVDRLPGALIRVARRLGIMRPGAILDRLGPALRPASLLQAELQGASDEERTLWSRAASFPGVLHADGLAALAGPDALERLRAQGMVVASPHGPRMLTVVRVALRAAAPDNPADGEHARWAASLGEAHTIEALDGPHGRQAWATLQARRDDLHTALAWAMKHRDGATATAAAIALATASKRSGWASQAVEGLGAADTLELSLHDRTRLHAAWADAHMRQRSYPQAQQHFEIAAQTPDPRMARHVVIARARAQALTGALEQGRAEVAALPQIDDRTGAWTLYVRAELTRMAGLYREADALRAEAFEAFVRHGSLMGQAGVLSVPRPEQTPAERCAAVAQAIALCRAAGDEAPIPSLWSMISTEYLRSADLTRSEHALTQARTVLARLGRERGLGWLLTNLAVIAFLRGDHAEAEASLDEAEAVAQRRDDRSLLARVHSDRGDMELERDAAAAALGHHQAATAAYRAVGHQMQVGKSLGNEGMVHLERGDLTTAGPLLREALAGVGADPAATAVLQARLAELHARQTGSDDTSAMEQAAAALETLGERFDAARTLALAANLAAPGRAAVLAERAAQMAPQCAQAGWLARKIAAARERSATR
jgi:tetratricopeptide (TPR) repeat protein